jgi:Arc/MetJ-type ribon-helix-helix transcriptional regulator
MASHSLMIEISDSAFQTLQQRIDSGKYATVNDAIEGALLESEQDLDWLTAEVDQSALEQEAVAAYDEYRAHPDHTYTSEQVLAYLAEQRSVDAQIR